ncbi:MAG: hypothetical protein OEZ03_05215 [Alphaproteobacteria bacterium]|jgi:hypothetical protein|nr:hypothetical protein [Alphaproteobacteria bacterium]
MRDVDRALADIANIRSQLAVGTMFRGFGPAVMAVTGLLSIVTAGVQSIWSETLAADPLILLGGWVATAVVCAALIVAEMLARSRRHHGGLADAMIWNAIQHFLPAGFAGGSVALVLARFAPDSLWLLPGLWQVLVALGIFASVRTLPPLIILVAAWYFVAGIAVLIVAGLDRGLSPWMMGLPFAAGQFMMATILYFASGEYYAEEQ